MKRKAPETAQEIRQAIERAETLIRLEQLTVDALKERLKAMSEPQTRPKLGQVDMLFCRTRDLETVGVKKKW